MEGREHNIENPEHGKEEKVALCKDFFDLFGTAQHVVLRVRKHVLFFKATVEPQTGFKHRELLNELFALLDAELAWGVRDHDGLHFCSFLETISCFWDAKVALRV